MLEKKFGDFLFDFLPDKSRTCPRYVYASVSTLEMEIEMCSN